jgi:hypothetical protein
MVHTRGRQTMIEREPSRLEQILAKHGKRWQIEREGPVWMATEHPSPTALHVIVARDLDALEQKITESEGREAHRPAGNSSHSLSKLNSLRWAGSRPLR